MRRQKIVDLFESRKGHLDARVHKEFVSNGIATIPCRITGLYDVISPFSVKRYETLNPDFAEYLKTFASVVPDEYPLVLEIVEDCLTAEDRKNIEETIADYYAYNLGFVEKEEKRHTKIFIFMTIGLILSGILLWFTQMLEEVPRELFFVLFWFMGDTICDYVFLTGHDLRKDRRLAGRLASIKVKFVKNFDESDYTNHEVDELYSEIEKDVKETLKQSS